MNEFYLPMPKATDIEVAPLSHVDPEVGPTDENDHCYGVRVYRSDPGIVTLQIRGRRGKKEWFYASARLTGAELRKLRDHLNTEAKL